MPIAYLLATVLFIIILTICPIQCSHFLGGTITWRISSVSSNGSLVAIRLSQTYSYVYSSAPCTSAAIAANQQIGASALFLTCTPACPAGFLVSTLVYCTDGSLANNIGVGTRSDIIWLPVNTSFTAMYVSSSWGTLTTGGSTWSVATYINIVRRSDTGLFNNPPVSNVVSPLVVSLRQRRTITVPVSDPDGDHLRCRWASSSSGGANECGSVCPPSSLPPGTVLYSNCTLDIPGANATSVYAIALMVEDFINSTSLTRMSSVPVQFIVKFIGSPNCSTPPEIFHDGSSCTTLVVNQTFITQVYAVNHCGSNVNITDFSSVSFPGMLQSDVKQINSSLFYKNLTWTPSMNQLGYQIMCLMALNSGNVQSSQYCLTFFVTENATSTCPGVIVTTNATTTAVQTTSATFSKTASDINWALIGTIIGLFFLALIICSVCLLRYLKKKSVKKQRGNKNHSPLQGTTSHPTSELSNGSPALKNSMAKSEANSHIGHNHIYPEDINVDTETPRSHRKTHLSKADHEQHINNTVSEIGSVVNADEHERKLHSKNFNHVAISRIHSEMQPKSKNVKDHHSRITPMVSNSIEETKSKAPTHDSEATVNSDTLQSKQSDHQRTNTGMIHDTDIPLAFEEHERESHPTKVIHVAVSRLHTAAVELKSKDGKDHHHHPSPKVHSRITPMSSNTMKETSHKGPSTTIFSRTGRTTENRQDVEKVSSKSGPRRSKTLIHLSEHMKTAREDSKHDHHHHSRRRRSQSAIIVQYIPRSKV